MTITKYISRDGVSTVDIPDRIKGLQVTEIGEFAFSWCTDLTGVTIPAGVIAIGNSAFLGCAGLRSVTIPAGVIAIGHWAFLGCAGLRSVTIPAGVIAIGVAAFYGCSGLRSVTLSRRTRVGDSTFPDRVRLVYRD
ncbi:MAG: leucine-rich repeat domain-containing protein [Spirochaetaceae bacterium]|jgi:hypothetical protein|nr:leucine-rich repeat domain-containing protein [Spirochaetaceae bacterium]